MLAIIFIQPTTPKTIYWMGAWLLSFTINPLILLIVNPVNKTNAAIRRHARRKAEAIQRELVSSRIDKVYGAEASKTQGAYPN
ncbi:MAG: hypothetical protein ACR5LF_06575 [Symbiopectobacterium sp.]